MSGQNGHHPAGGAPVPTFQGFPSLPIVTPDPPRRTQTQKYGGLFYLGIGGLAVLISLIGWFSFRLWSLRDVWSNVYTLYDKSAPEDLRIQAAYSISRDPRVTSAQRKDFALSLELPDLARYLIAESLGPDVVLDEPRSYPMSVARSASWPAWLRLLLTRPLALATAGGAFVPAEPLEELRKNPDRMIALWAACAQAAGPKPLAAAAQTMDQAATDSGTERELAVLLKAATSASEAEQKDLFARATLWLRTHHPDASRIWSGWEIQDGKLQHVLIRQ